MLYYIYQIDYRSYHQLSDINVWKNVAKELDNMKFIIIGKNIDVTPGLKDAVESKLGKLQRYFTPDTEIHVTLSVQKEHQKIEVTIL